MLGSRKGICPGKDFWDTPAPLKIWQKLPRPVRAPNTKQPALSTKVGNKNPVLIFGELWGWWWGGGSSRSILGTSRLLVKPVFSKMDEFPENLRRGEGGAQWANLSLDAVELVSNQHLLYFGHNLYLRRWQDTKETLCCLNSVAWASQPGGRANFRPNSPKWPLRPWQSQKCKNGQKSFFWGFC